MAEMGHAPTDSRTPAYKLYKLGQGQCPECHADLEGAVCPHCGSDYGGVPL